MIGGRPQSLYSRYLREVIWGKCLRSPKLSPAMYVQLSRRGNRYFYLALRFLSSKSRPCAVLSKKPYIVGPLTYRNHMDDYARLAYSHPHAQFCRGIPHETGDKILVHDGSEPGLTAGDWNKVVRIDYDIASTAPPDAPWMMMPYPMHPLIYATGLDRDLRGLRRGDRPMRIFFAGNVDRDVYTSSRSMRAIRRRFGMLDRVRVIDSLIGGLGDCVRQIKRVEELREAVDAGPPRTCTRATDRSVRIGVEDWLATLAKCDVFLAPPGVFIPLCHNATEAMAAGCVPLTNYAEWFTPHLEHMKNCVRFTDEADLVEKAKMVLDMEPGVLAEMRANVIEYYDQFLAPDRFLDRLFDHPARELTLFMATESRSILERVNGESVIVTSGGEVEDARDSRESRSPMPAGAEMT